MISISARQSNTSPASSIRAKRGSMGILAICWPILVRLPFCARPFLARVLVKDCSSNAPSSMSSLRPSLTNRKSGGVIKSNDCTSPSCSRSICKITDAKFVRRISGSVNSGRLLKSSSEYIRIHTPGATRPQRPFR